MIRPVLEGQCADAAVQMAPMRWKRAALIGGLLGLIPQAWMLTEGTWNPLRWGRLSDFYDEQARALLDGTFAMDQRILGIESFARGDQHFMYFGPVPALLRLPFVTFTRSLDGQLAAVSMFSALIVLMAATMHLGWRLRQRVLLGDVSEPTVDVSRIESVGVALTMFSIVGASSLLYASSRTWIYHEAILWGSALTMAAIAVLLVWMDTDDINSRQSHRLLVLTSSLTMLALLTRPSVAGGALAALGLVMAKPMVDFVIRGRRGGAGSTVSTPAIEPRLTGLTFVLMSAALSAPIVSYSIVNWLKFRRLLGVPFDQQGYTLLIEQRREMLEANGGTLFNWKFLPTNLMSYLRPDLIGIDTTFPFLHMRRPVSTIGSPVYDLMDLTSGLPTTMPFLVVLSVVGAWAVARATNDRMRPLRLILAGCLLGTVAVMAIGYLANRYQSDFLPLLVVSALIGLPVATRWLQAGSSATPRRRTFLFIAAPVLVTVGFVVNLAFGYSYQRVFSPPTHPAAVSSYLDSQQRVDGWIGDGKLARLSVTERLPAQGGIGDVVIVGDCSALFISDGRVPPDRGLFHWQLAELAGEQGASRGTLTLNGDPEQEIPLVHLATSGDGLTVSVESDPVEGVMTTVITTVNTRRPGPDLPLRAGEALQWQVFADPYVGRLNVYLDGRFAAYAEIPADGAVFTTVARNLDELPGVVDDAASFVTTEPIETPVCNRLRSALDEAESSP